MSIFIGIFIPVKNDIYGTRNVIFDSFCTINAQVPLFLA